MGHALIARLVTCARRLARRWRRRPRACVSAAWLQAQRRQEDGAGIDGVLALGHPAGAR